MFCGRILFLPDHAWSSKVSVFSNASWGYIGTLLKYGYSKNLIESYQSTLNLSMFKIDAISVKRSFVNHRQSEQMLIYIIGANCLCGCCFSNKSTFTCVLSLVIEYGYEFGCL